MSIISAKFASKCQLCGEVISVGDSIEWTSGNPASHEACARIQVAGLSEIEHEEAELQAMLDKLKAKKNVVIQAAIAAQKELAMQAELQKQVKVTVLQYMQGGKLQVQFEERSDLRAILLPMNSWIRESYVAVADWTGIEVKILARPNVMIDWQGDSKAKYEWHLNAPAWDVDLSITNDITMKAGPSEQQRWAVDSIPGARWNWKDREYFIPRSEAWRIPETLKRTEDVKYSDVARRVIFDQIEGRAKLDTIARQEDCSPEFLEELKQALGYDVWNPAKRIHEPFWQFLRPFQRINVEFAIAGGGRYLNGDDTGLGKTAEGIALAQILRHRGLVKQTVCIVKSANIPNWIRELKNLAQAEPLVLRSGKPDGTEIHKIMFEKTPWVMLSYDTIGSKTYTKKNQDKDDDTGFYPWTQIFQSAQPEMLLLDEGHQIKNRTTHRFRAIRPLQFIPYVVPLTASPILNRASELWTLLHMVAPHQFPSFEQFVNRYTYDGANPKDIEKLHELIRPIFLRRRKKDVMKDLPPINRIVHYHTLSDRAEKLYQRILQGIYVALEHFDPSGQGGTEMHIMSILAQITRLKQVCAADKVEYTSNLALELADENEGKKILIFSQWKGTALSIARKLGSEAVCTVRVNKSNKFQSMNATERDELFESVRNDPKVRFIVTTEAAKEGHNLEFCDFVMFNDLFWTPEGHRQCEGRAYGRMSNPHPIDSFYITADVDIERWIMELLEKKMAIIEATIDQVESSRDTTGSIANELIGRVKDQMMRQGKRKIG